MKKLKRGWVLAIVAVLVIAAVGGAFDGKKNHPGRS